MRSSIVATLVAVALAGCATVDRPDDRWRLSDSSIQVVIARGAGSGQGPIGIADRFSTDGKIFAFVSIVWPDAAATREARPAGAETFESRWYSGDRLVVQREVTFNITRTPFNFWSAVFPVNLGPGPARYELCSHGRKVAEKSFLIVAPAVSTAGPDGRAAPG